MTSLLHQCNQRSTVIMAGRPPSSFGRPETRGRDMPLMTGSGRPLGTASRLATANRQRPGTKGSAAVGGAAISSQIQITDRPMTQQGMVGMQTGNRGPNRQVQDKSYFLGLLRSKINELKTECQKMNKEVEEVQSESQTFLSYEKRAEKLANEIKHLQGELGDYNTLNDKLNTDTDIRDVERDYDDLKSHNDVEEKGLDFIFEEKKSKDAQVEALNEELKQETMMADSMVANMPEKMRTKYMRMRETNEHLSKILREDSKS
ncbi:IFT74 [Bugula neritina]|uniref:IFT74 n=1 Tax=Bugula neritina TaxID=10212 RepID=A0A7J7KK44_BUGNE|nr:IFT74 [Bugula neritina]